LLVCSAIGCGGCSPLYLIRSAYEESRILFARQPIEKLLADDQLDADTRAKLQLVLDVRRFAEERIGLDVGGAYASYSVVASGALLNVLSAAEQTRLKPYEWWFPIVGNVEYKGYFDRADADRDARRLEADGYDTYVRGSIGFSTLGWFDDPVLSSWLAWDQVNLAELLIHEMLHRTYYLPGQTAFNESLATFVGNRGAIAFFRERDGEDAETTRRAVAAWDEDLVASRLWGSVVKQLEALYDTSARNGVPVERILQDRLKIFAEIGDWHPETEDQPPARPRLFGPVNNASILATYVYVQDLDVFEGLLGKTNGDLRAALQRVRAVTEKAKDPFIALATAQPEG
jgi:predicted aminopeptidase